ncbi:MAG: helix-turn-helix domain-containing protein [Erysipelotrichaceae bacterium]
MDQAVRKNGSLVKYFHFIIHDESSIYDLEQVLSSLTNTSLTLQAVDHKMGHFMVVGDEVETLITTLPILLYDGNLSATFLVSHENDKLTYYSLLHCVQFGMNKVHHLSDILMMLLFNGDQKTRHLLNDTFHGVDRELINTANEFLKSGLNANKASTKLYLHRNTLSYRLQKFIQTTNLDIRDYYNAQVLYIYLISNR